MKKMTVLMICLLLAFSLTGCGGQEKTPAGDTMKICIDDVCYVNTDTAVPAEPDESAIAYVEIPVGGDAVIKAFARIQEGRVTPICSVSLTTSGIALLRNDKDSFDCEWKSGKGKG